MRQTHIDTSSVAPLNVAQIMSQDPWYLTLPHHTDTHRLLWTTQAQGRITINGIRRGFGPHNAIWLPAGTLVTLEPMTQIKATLISFPADAGVHWPDEPLHLRLRDAQAQKDGSKLIEMLTAECIGERSLADVAVAAHLDLLAVWLQRQTIEADVDMPDLSEDAQLVRAFSRLMAESAAMDKTLGEYAMHLEVEVADLSAACDYHAGFTAEELLEARKLHMARNHLRHTEAPIPEIADYLGFESPGYFERFLHERTGQTAHDLRAA